MGRTVRSGASDTLCASVWPASGADGGPAKEGVSALSVCREIVSLFFSTEQPDGRGLAAGAHGCRGALFQARVREAYTYMCTTMSCRWANKAKE